MSENTINIKKTTYLGQKMRQAQTLKDTEIKRVLAYCATRQHSARDTTIVVFSINAGLRAKELAALRVELLSNLVFEACRSCGDLVGVCGFNSVFERDACDDFG
jgi:hypothetical protein